MSFLTRCAVFTGLCLLSVWAQAVVILQYHHISDETPASTSTSPELFRQHLQYLVNNDFSVLPLPQVIAALRAGETLPDKTVVITFDDSYRSIYEVGFPLLQKYELPFTVFINTAPIGTSPRDFMSWDDIKAMSDAGAVIANHTHTHPHMVRLEEGETRAEWRSRIRDEIEKTEAAIKKHTGQNHKLLAYPYGEYDAKVIAELKSLGFLGIGQHSGAVGPGSDWYTVPRFPMGGSFGNMNDFPTKVFSLPLPTTQIAWQSADGTELKDPTVRAGDKPVLDLTLENEALAAGLTCYFQGALMPKTVDGKRVRIETDKALRPGRSRYNCTARDDATGRFHWFSQPWLVQNAEGDWQHEN